MFILALSAIDTDRKVSQIRRFLSLVVFLSLPMLLENVSVDIDPSLLMTTIINVSYKRFDWVTLAVNIAPLNFHSWPLRLQGSKFHL